MKRAIFLLIILLALSAQTASAAITAALSLQGILRDSDGKAVDDGTYSLTFKVYSASTGGTALETTAKSVTVVNGVYSVVLSGTDLDALTFSVDYYIGITYNGTEFPDRVQLTASPYAMALVGTSNVFPSSGSVGVGTTSPTSTLHVVGSSYLNGAGTITGTLSTGINDNTGGFFNVYGGGTGTTEGGQIDIYNSDASDGTVNYYSVDAYNGELRMFNSSSNNYINFKANNDVCLNQSNTGKVGIGTSSPSAPLHVIANGSNLTGSSNGIYLYDAGTASTNHAIICATVNGSTAGDPYLQLDVNSESSWSMGIDNSDGNKLKFDNVWGSVGGATKMTIQTDGHVGIGTSSPSALLHVTGTGAYFTYGSNADQYGYNGQDAVNSGSSSDVLAYFSEGRVIVDHSIIAAESPSPSDSRAKRVLGRSDNRADLETLNQLKITDYQWIDRALNQGRPQKKVIAQEVERVYPNAVTQTENVLPTIYANAQKVEYDADKKQLTLTTEQPHDFAIGDKVNVFTDQGNLTMREVLTVPSPNEFVIASDHSAEKAFVYGKWVKDYRVVDYEAISMLNVSATQELAKQMASLQTENAALKTKLAELESLKTEMAAIKAMLNGADKPQVKQTSLH